LTSKIDPGNSAFPKHFLNLKEAYMVAAVELDLSANDLAEKFQCSPRTINIWKAQAEKRLGRKLGYKDPTDKRVIRFKPEEQREILKSRMEAEPVEETVRSHQQQATNSFDHLNNQAEAGVIGGMATIVESGDQNAIQIGQALGQRWNALMWTAALQEMQSGMVTMQTQFEEMHASVQLSFDRVDVKQLTGKSELFLEGG
jgi:hypothetical protein